jgi:6-phosphogluconolactonase
MKMIRVYPDFESLSLGAAELFAQLAETSVEAREQFSVALAGGNTPRRMYEFLSQNPLRHRVPWDKARVFWGDERCVPADDPRSNARMARRVLLEHVPVASARIHPIECAELPEDAARRYESLLRTLFAEAPPRLDIVLLGLGENGHTASLFPFTPALAERERWVSEVRAADQDISRITMTAPLLNRARAVVFIVSSAAKAQVLKEVLEGPRDPVRLPAQLIQPELHGGEIYWLTDMQAASLLSGKISCPQAVPRGNGKTYCEEAGSRRRSSARVLSI